MTHKEVATMISAMGVPYAYQAFSPDTAKAPPFICFFYGNSEDMIADNINYQKIDRLYIELYTDQKDFTLEATVEGILTNYELPFFRSETYIDGEHMYEVIFETTVVITEDADDTDIVGRAKADYAKIRR